MPALKEVIYRELLVLRCRRGQKQAFEELVRLWEKRLFYYIRRLVATEEDAWDVLQETWVKVLKGITSLKDAHKLPTWLYRVARNTALSRQREVYKQQTRMEESGQFSEVEAPEEDPPQDAEEVHRALSRISLAHREVLTLYFLRDLSVNQMAEVLQLPLGTVKSRLHYAKRALRAALSQRESDHE